ncbi:LysM peptidoglycan-binding domain-containing protein [Alteromonas gilva]|uniref:LysM domain-containing protein n=1 Tax=Alteromonas gilva TaxID=2987522 RepID=A0ABT5KWW8_9ALTE|nr:LysM domain-containing protein [Alteromonas gilva]MDC8829138.1 LysM domain-containing protein [Alteromonas gilva]
MVKQIKKWAALCAGLILGLTAGLAQGLEIKPDAPTQYTVKKNDTLWDIAGMFLDKPWLWPELWRNNTQIINPHLIYPGNVLTLRFIDGEPVLEVTSKKNRVTLTPDAERTVKSLNPINLLPWSAIAPYIQQHEIIDPGSYDNLPHLLGNKKASMLFASDDLVMSRRNDRANDQYRVIRKQSTITDLDGNVLGIQVHHIADATMVEASAEGEWLVKIAGSNAEAKRGDKLLDTEPKSGADMALVAATQSQRSFIVGSLHQHELLGKHDIVIVDLGAAQVSAGTVMGIYQQGPTIIDGESPEYASENNSLLTIFDSSSTFRQPAIKVGELVIFSTFSRASYGIITRASEMVRSGNIVAQP